MVSAYTSTVIEPGDRVSDYAAQLCRQTYGYNRYIKVHNNSRGNFRGSVSHTYQRLPRGWQQLIAPDGCGTRTMVDDAAGRYLQAARSVIAMTGADITCEGGVRLVFTSIIDYRSIDEGNIAAAQQLYDGLFKVATQEGIPLIKGESAILGVGVGSCNKDAHLPFNWSGFMLGAKHPKTEILGDRMAVGDVVATIKENGFRSNGYGDVRRAFDAHYGSEWPNLTRAAEDLFRAVEPPVLFDRFLETVNGWLGKRREPLFPLSLCTHVTGGGIPNKLGEKLKGTGFSAVLDDLWEPPTIMRSCAQWLDHDDKTSYKVWNGGNGGLIILPPEHLGELIKRGERFGHEIKPCGQLIHDRGENVVITSKFNGGELVF